jgi:hypothetical protein
MADFKSGARRTSVPARLPGKRMIAIAAAANDDEVAAAAYLASRTP